VKTVLVGTSKPYKVLIGEGLLAQTGALLKERISPCTAVLAADDRVDAICGEIAERSLEAQGFRVLRWTFPQGEGSKNMETLGRLLEFMARNEVTRSDLLVALGGGVTGDLAGFAAAVYLRGIRCVQLPTTLLAAVDSSVGGKTAVDLAAGKNLAGAFHQPEMVICDLQTFSSLNKKVFGDGVAEAVKYGVIADRGLFERIAAGAISGNLEEIVADCVAIKAMIVGEDEYDNGARQLLNFGHTLGHAVERCSNFTIRHGQAVAVGMVLAARAAERFGLAEEPCSDEIRRVLEAHGLPTQSPFDAAALCKAAVTDKKRRGDFITLVVPRRIGECFLHGIPVAELLRFIRAGLGEQQ
jgi:3-dehydroquinate synthase